MLNKKELGMRQIEPLWSVSGTHTSFVLKLLYCFFSNHLTPQLYRVKFYVHRQTDRSERTGGLPPWVPTGLKG